MQKLTPLPSQYAAGAGLLGSTLAATGLYLYQCRLIYPSYVPDGSRKSESILESCSLMFLSSNCDAALELSRADPRPVVPTPIDVALAYEDVKMTTSDGVRIRGFVIPARRSQVSTPDLKAMSPGERKTVAEKEVGDWIVEMGDEKAVEVRADLV